MLNTTTHFLFAIKFKELEIRKTYFILNVGKINNAVKKYMEYGY